MSADQWAGYFLDSLLAQLSAAERDALTRLCIFDTTLDDEVLAYAEIKPEWVSRWSSPLPAPAREGVGAPVIPPHMQGAWACCPKPKNASCAAGDVHGASCYPRIHDRTNDEGRKTKGAWVGRGVLWPAISRYWRGGPWIARSGKLDGPEGEVESLARTQVVGANVARTDDMVQARKRDGPQPGMARRPLRRRVVRSGGRDRQRRLRHPGPLG